MPGDGPAQLRAALVGQTAQKLRAVVQHHAALEPAPHGKGKIRRAVGGEVQHRELHRLLRNRLRRRERLGRGGVVHKIAHPLAGDDIALGQKLLVGILHRDFAQLQIPGQIPLGRQPAPFGQDAAENILAQMSVKALIKGHSPGFFQIII